MYKITWPQLEDLFIKRVENIVPVEQKRLIKKFRQLKKDVEEFFPEAVENPSLLIETPSEKVPDSFHNLHYQHLDVIRKLKVVISRLIKHEEAASGISAEQKPFGKSEIEHCMALWLIKNGWLNVNVKRQLSSTFDVTAQKDGLLFWGTAIRSVNEKKRTYNRWEYVEEDFLNYPAFKQRLGAVVLALIEKMQENENSCAAVLIAGDTPTVNFAAQYVKHLNKAGIKMYCVKSVNDIAEL